MLSLSSFATNAGSNSKKKSLISTTPTNDAPLQSQHHHRNKKQHHHNNYGLGSEGGGKLSRHRRASSDCCLHKMSEDDTRPQDLLLQHMFIKGGGSFSPASSSACCSRSASPLPSPGSGIMGLMLAPRRCTTPTGEGTTPTISRPVTPNSLPISRQNLLLGNGKDGSNSKDRCPSRASIPEIYVSGDFGGSPSTSPSSSSPHSLEHFLHDLECEKARKKGVSSNDSTGSRGAATAAAGGSKRRSPMTGRRAVADAGAGTATPAPLQASGSSTTPQQTRSRGASTVSSAAPSSSQHQDDALTHSSNEDWDGDVALSSAVSNGSGEAADSLRCAAEADDSTDGRGGAQQQVDRIKEASDHLQTKIVRTRDLIKQEQKARDDNVNEYLKCAASADKLQISRIKAVFEKKNQKSATSIQQLQKKLDNYQRRLQDLQTHGLNTAHRQPKEMLRDMGQGLRSVGGNILDGFSGLSGSGLISKPREFAHLIKNKFGSADNIKEILSDDDRDEERTHHGSATLPPGVCLNSCSTTPTANTSTTANCFPTIATAPAATNINSGGGGGGGGGSGGYHSGGGGGSSGGGGGAGSGGGASEEGSECNSSLTSESMTGAGLQHHHHHHLPPHQLASPRPLHSQELGGYASLDQVVTVTQEARVEIDRFRDEVETIKSAFMAESSALHERLAEERTRVEQLEQQVNDLTELHQNEMENLKTTMTDMEEKVQYQSEERVRDLHEMLENCHTRISRMEHQQAQQQQQFLTLEGLENSTARALFVKLINILLTILQVLLLIVATAMNILAPLLQTRGRLLFSFLVLVFAVTVYIQLPYLREVYWTIGRKYSWITS